MKNAADFFSLPVIDLDPSESLKSKIWGFYFYFTKRIFIFMLSLGLDLDRLFLL